MSFSVQMGKKHTPLFSDKVSGYHFSTLELTQLLFATYPR